MPRYALLLRGINLGRAHRIGMADLRELLTAAGHGEVRTLLQSGNVVLDAGLPAAELARSVELALQTRFGFAVPTVVRTRDELLDVVARDPLGDVADDGARYVVAFMAEPPGPALDELLGSVEPGDDRYVCSGRELYLWCPHGQLQSPLMAALATAKGGPVTTVRNWNTVQKLADLLQR